MRPNKIYSPEFLDRINKGGWMVVGGHLARKSGYSNLPVVKASFLQETRILLIETVNYSFQVPSDNITSFSPWEIEIRHTYTRRQESKKVEGGGWHEAPTVGVALKLTNPTLEKTIREQWAETARREKEELERLESEALSARQKGFVSALNAAFDRMEFIRAEAKGSGLRIHFLDRTGAHRVIDIASEDCDCCCGNGGAVVNGISLCNFLQSEYPFVD